MTARTRAPARRRSSTRTVTRAAVALAAATALAGCASEDIAFMNLPDLPESEGVDDAPWPRLIDAPAVAPQSGPGGVGEATAKGEDLERSLADEAAALRAEDAAMRSEPVLRSNLDREAARVRAQARAAAANGG